MFFSEQVVARATKLLLNSFFSGITYTAIWLREPVWLKKEFKLDKLVLSKKQKVYEVIFAISKIKNKNKIGDRDDDFAYLEKILLEKKITNDLEANFFLDRVQKKIDNWNKQKIELNLQYKQELEKITEEFEF